MMVSIPFRDFTLFCVIDEAAFHDDLQGFNPFQGFYIVLPTEHYLASLGVLVSIPFRDFTLFCQKFLRHQPQAPVPVSIPFRDFTLFCP